MHRMIAVVLALAFSLVFAACGGSTTDTNTPQYTPDGDATSDGDTQLDGDDPILPDGDDTTDGDVASDGDETVEDGDDPSVDGDEPMVDGDEPIGACMNHGGPITPACAALVEGTNTGFMVDGQAREFILNLPANVDDGEPLAVIFNWHGLGDTASNMSRLFSGMVNNTTMPFILVTPEDTGLMPLSGLDWAILSVDQNNIEARLFDEVLGCLQQRWCVDETHIHSAGFSAGAIMTDALAVVRGDLLASVISYSGIYFSNPENSTGFDNWISPTTSNQYAQLLIHGGPQDNFNASLLTIQFNEMGARDVGYLNGLGHDVVHCNHGGGHTIPGVLQGMLPVEFFAAHPKGTSNTPYFSNGLPTNYPDYCSVSTKN